LSEKKEASRDIPERDVPRGIPELPMTVSQLGCLFDGKDDFGSMSSYLSVEENKSGSGGGSTPRARRIFSRAIFFICLTLSLCNMK
jgi:hypothetical protein